MDFREYRRLVAADLQRLNGMRGARALWWAYREVPGFHFMFWLRSCRYLRSQRLAKWLLYPIARWRFNALRFKYGISIPFHTEIGPGFYIGHYGGIVVNGDCRIGRNCNISHGVTLGQTNRGRRRGVPTVGDNVYIGPGAKVIGAVHVADHAAIGANAVVTSDVPPRAVVVGAPARVVSYAGSEGYVEHTV